MLRKLEKNEMVPPLPTRNWSPARQFAEGTLAEFLATTQPGDVCEVEGFEWPINKVMSAFASAIFYAKRRGEVRAFQRQGHVYLRWGK